MQGLFGLGKFTLDVLIQATREHDFAVLVLTSDDFLNQRGVPTNVPRDNVIFELGLFMGAIGKERSFIVHDKGITLPTDLDGVTRASFSTLDLNSAYQMLKEAIVGAPGRGRDLNGRWFSAYQRHDDKLGRWVRDIVEIQCRSSGKLTFRNYNDPAGSNYEAIGEFHGKNEIVGTWYETLDTANAKGTFHLYKDPYFPKLYGVCTGPTTKGQNVYSGWILVRDDADDLANARRDLLEAVLVYQSKLPPKGRQ